MKKSTAIWLIVASAIILFGLLLLVFAMSLDGWSFDKREETIYEISEDFTNISITLDTDDVFFTPSPDGTKKVVCLEDKNLGHTVSVEGGTLKIGVDDNRKWYNHIFNFGETSVTVYLPESEYNLLSIDSDTSDVSIPNNFKFGSIDIELSTGDARCYASTVGDVKIRTSTGRISLADASFSSLLLKASTGDISLSAVKCGDINISVSTGEIKLTNVSCKSLTAEANTGDVEMINVIASGAFAILTDTGDVDFEASDAAEIYIETDTGDVSGTLLSEKVFFYKTDTGDVQLPETTKGGICKIITDTGDIEIYIKN